MIYISAQPDSTYFIWQLEIQLRNFSSLGINRDQIQVIIGYNKSKGLKKEFADFIEANGKYANFFTYPDLRENPKYTSSIRPNILKQHFAQYPSLADETIFYHDSDILFSRIPQIENIEINDICYVSDTRNYLDKNYICRTSSEDLLANMLAVVGLPKEVLEREDRHTGGAQYILKGINADFWEKVEQDSENLFVLMKEYNKILWEQEYEQKKEYRSKKRGIQAWCADMWAVLWNLWYRGKKVEIHAEMDFSWPYNPIKDWERLAIQHYSGNVKEKEKFFKKNEYLNYMPWYDDSLSEIPDTNCSYKIVELIRDRKKELDESRKPFSTSCIVVHTDLLNSERLESWRLFEKYITTKLDIDVYLYAQELICEDIPENAFQNEEYFHNIVARRYKQLLWLPLEYMLDISEVSHMFEEASIKNRDWLTFKAENIYKVDKLFVETFSKVLDMELLELNKGKFNIVESKVDKLIYLIKLSEKSTERKIQIGSLFADSPNSREGKPLPIPSIFNIL